MVSSVPSLYESVGLDVKVYEPLARGTSHLCSLNIELDSYSHTSAAMGGYASADISAKMNREVLDSWLDDGLGRHIVVYDQAQQKAWEGFVNSVEAQIGRLRATCGPLLNISNRIWGRYTPLDTTATPPARGPETVTGIVEDLDSQARHGIVERVLALGEQTQIDAEQTQDTYLIENAWPETNLDVGDPGAPSLRLSCLGYWEWLAAAIFYSGLISTRTVSNPAAANGMLQVAIGWADTVNPWCFSQDYSQMATNALLAPAYSNDDKTCRQVIEELVSLGDANDVRYTFGLYENRIAYYAAMPTTYEYTAKVGENGLELKLWNGGEVKPWAAKPARWMFLSDFLLGLSVPGLPRQDRRAVFIEQVTYTAPYGLQFTPGKTGTLAQVLAKKGLGGI